MNQSQAHQYPSPRRQATAETGAPGALAPQPANPAARAASTSALASGSAPDPASNSASAVLPSLTHDELHMSGLSPQRLHMSPQHYTPQIKLEQPPPANAQSQPSYQHQPSNSVPNVLQPGGLTARPPALSANTAPALPTVSGSRPPSHDPHQQQYQLHNRPSQELQQPTRLSLNMSHTYSRSSPAGSYDTPSGYHAYTPTTPGGSNSGTSQFMSPADVSKYQQAGQRHISNTPLGLADIRPRADSSMSDGPGTLGYDLAHAQAGTSNYLAPWPIYAFDWCKWRPQANSAGKVAVGSYLEDGHNFVSRHARREAINIVMLTAARSKS